jgi:hypothetical protein
MSHQSGVRFSEKVTAMPYKVNCVDVWTGEIEDRVGGLAAKLESLADAGADLEMVIARRQPGQPGKGVVFVGPVTGAGARKAAAATGLAKSGDLAALRVEGPNRPGECSRLTRRLAEAGLNLRGISAAALGTKCVVLLAFDTSADAGKAARLLRAAGSRRKAPARR